MSDLDDFLRRARWRIVWLACGAALLVALLVTSGWGSEPVQPAPPTPRPVGATIHELDTITGALDGHELVGQRVDLHVDAVTTAEAVDDGTRFWVGPRDNRVLVIAGHANTDRMASGHRYAIAGTVRRLPVAEERASWKLTEDDHLALGQRPIYVAADRVTPEG